MRIVPKAFGHGCHSTSFHLPRETVKNMFTFWSTWVTQSVKRPTSAQVMISPFCEFEPRMGLAAVSTQPTLDPLCFPSLLRPQLCSLSLKINK